jgi:hypothetical protein
MAEQCFRLPARVSVTKRGFSVHSTQPVALYCLDYPCGVEDEGEEFCALPKCCQVSDRFLGLFIRLEPEAEAMRAEGHNSSEADHQHPDACYK